METEIALKHNEITRIFHWFSDIPQMAQTADFCCDIGFSLEQTKELLRLKPVQYTGKLRSPKTGNSYDADDVTACLERLPATSGFILAINGISIIQWFKQKLEELQQKQTKNPRQAVTHNTPKNSFKL